MKKTEIEFLRAAGFSIAEIMAMEPAPAGDQASAGDQQPAASGDPAPAQTPAADPAPAAAPAQQAPAASPAAQPDNNPAMTALLQQILAAVQAGNRSGAALPTPEKKTPEEIAGQLY